MLSSWRMTAPGKSFSRFISLNLEAYSGASFTLTLPWVRDAHVVLLGVLTVLTSYSLLSTVSHILGPGEEALSFDIMKPKS